MIERFLHVHSSDSDNDSGERTMISADDVVPSVAFSPDGKLLASGSEDGTVILWDVSDPRSPVQVLWDVSTPAGATPAPSP